MTLHRRTALALPALLLAPRLVRADDLVDAARREGTAVFHTSIDLPVAHKMVSAFEAAYPGIRLQLERAGSVRILQRIEQEHASGIFAADVVETTDATTFLGWKQKSWLAAHVPPDAERFWPKSEIDRDGMFAAARAQLSVISWNTKQIKPEDAPKSFADLLAPKWRNRLVKSHPGYSGVALTATFATQGALGWAYFEALAKQKVMQVQSATDPPKKVSQGERSIAVDGSENVAIYLRAAGNPIDVTYAVEGTPLISGQLAVMKDAPHPNAARLFMNFVFSLPCQQVMANEGMRSFHPEVKLAPGIVPLSQIKLLRTDPAALLAAGDEMKRKYAEIFGV